MTAAIALKQQGIDAVVAEAAPALHAAGAGIVMQTNAMLVLQRLGLAEKVQANGFELTRGSIADQNWRTIQKMDMEFGKKHFGIGAVAIHRGALQKILFEELPESAVMLGHKVESIARDNRRAVVKFTNGHTEEGDFVIGADGIKSVVRQSLFGKTEYRYSGQTCWRAAVAVPVPEKLRQSTYELWGSKAGLRFGLVAIAENLVYFFATVAAPEGGTDDPRTLKSDLARLFGEFGELPLSLINAADTAKIIRTDIYDFAPISRWHEGQVALIGDAAHATTPNLGQGGCQAVEDAFVIAKALKDFQEPAKAFEAFQATRFEKANYVVNASWQFARLTNLSPAWLISLRNGLLRLVPASAGAKTLHRLYTLNY